MKRCLLGLAALLSLGGCAYSDHVVHIEPPVHAHRGQPLRQTIAITVFELADERADRSRVGIVKNGPGWETANVLMPEDLRAVVSNALVLDLQAAGFIVTRVDRDYVPRSDEVAVRGSILDVMEEPYVIAEPRELHKNGITVQVALPDFLAQVKIHLEARVHGERYERTFAGHAHTEAPSDFLVDASKTVLDLALADASAQAADGMVALAPSFCACELASEGRP